MEHTPDPPIIFRIPTPKSLHLGITDTSYPNVIRKPRFVDYSRGGVIYILPGKTDSLYIPNYTFDNTHDPNLLSYIKTYLETNNIPDVQIIIFRSK